MKPNLLLAFFLLLFAMNWTASTSCAASESDDLSAECLPHTDPANIGEWQLQDAFSDEFNDDTLSSIWHVQGKDDGEGAYYNANQGRNSQFIPEAISQSEGILRIKSHWNPSFPFAKGYGVPPITTGALISKKLLKYGYMEIRCRVGKSPMSGAFWAVGNGVNDGNRGELDIFEHVGQGWDAQKDNTDISTTMQMSIHNWNRAINENLGNRRHWTQKHSLGFDVTDGMHVYAADWTEDYIKFYVDGALVRTLSKEEADDVKLNGHGAWVIDNEQRVWIDCELFDWEGRVSELKADMFGEEAVFEVDYVRVWKRGAGGNHKHDEHGANLVANGNFATNLDGWNTQGLVAIQDVSNWKYWKDNNPSLDPNAMQIGAGGTGAANQVISVEPNSKYILTAYLRTPGTTGTLEPSNLRIKPVVFHEGWFGVEDYGGSRLTRKLFHNWFQSYSIEFTTGSSDRTATIFFNNTESQRGGLMHVDGVTVVKVQDLRRIRDPALPNGKTE
ncbi:family 16 glycosylhydrolase [Aureliella helgolandensis]|uniref:Beta-agarase A n=1 Tax=Aureliella helgolandensis TaxID=2527968 RepID=A0A518G1P6_9BACT|nr:family 16 glycosylhydrolase [Aureliella helgolandensis]QDV22519.1 Beta-agarase A precursor [Aureliella helgolandensis]